MPAQTIHITLVGTGSLARSILMGLASQCKQAVSVVVVGRNAMAVRHACTLAQSLAAKLGNPLHVREEVCNFLDLHDVQRVFSTLPMRVCLTAASLQSPWSMAPAWQQVVQRLGYGFTLPLQAWLAERVMRVVHTLQPNAHLINACYPDAVNPVLWAKGIPVEAGIGNIAILEAVLQGIWQTEASPNTPADAWAMLAHHTHVSATIAGHAGNLPAPAIWQQGRRIDDQRSAHWLQRLSLPADERINALTGAIAVPMLLSLLGHEAPWYGHLPGVQGLAGGYPVHVDQTGVDLALPEDLSLAEALALNTHYSHHDGVRVEGGICTLSKSPEEIERVTAWDANLLHEWHVDQLQTQVDLLQALRAQLASTHG